ncbi:hypothetical protein PHMEG_00013459 [Phytophthora megakarya]|uniref:Tyr recombinase domain-containing protein n=1 Tax=Phytophthora megakarya TaxID=4795 RepID=A0A225W6P8_9STRA|nr:hypothetical protein PHMEG_00013459 [Phytophthora megakarya]
MPSAEQTFRKSSAVQESCIGKVRSGQDSEAAKLIASAKDAGPLGFAVVLPRPSAMVPRRTSSINRSARQFTLCKVGPRQILQVNDVVTAFKHAAAANGENPDRFGSHSLRSGSATALFNAGVASLTEKKFGRWRFDAVEVYTVLKTDLSSTLAKQMLTSTHN